jgi:hypothetical protein
MTLEEHAAEEAELAGADYLVSETFSSDEDDADEGSIADFIVESGEEDEEEDEWHSGPEYVRLLREAGRLVNDASPSPPAKRSRHT